MKTDLKGKCGWLSPSGQFFECHYTLHWEKAREICELFQYKELRRSILVKDPEYTLEQNGWVKLTLGSVYFSPDSRKRLSKKQVDFLFNYLMANGRNTRMFEQVMEMGRADTHADHRESVR